MNYTYKDIAISAGASESYICLVVWGKRDASEKLSLRLEQATGIKKDWWRNPKKRDQLRKALFKRKAVALAEKTK